MSAMSRELVPIAPASTALAVLPPAYASYTPPPQGASSLLSMADNLLQHVRLFGSVWLIALLVGVVYLVAVPPVYRADTMIQIDGRGPRPTASTLAQTQGGRSNEAAPPGYMLGEAEILRSREIVSKAITQTRADVQVTVDSRLPLLGRWYARAFAADARAPVAPPLGLSLLDGFAWGGESLRVAQLRVPASQYDEPIWLEATDGKGGWALRGLNGERVQGTVGQEVAFNFAGEPALLQVASLTARPGTRFKLIASDPALVHDMLTRNLRVEEAGRQSGVIRVSLNHSDPRFARQFLDVLSAAYLEHHLGVSTGEASRALRFLEAQLPDVKRELDRAEEALNRYRTSANTYNVSMENESALRRIADLERERIGIDIKRQQAAQRFTPAHPEMVALQRQLGSVSGEIGRLKGQMQKAPQQEKDVVRLQRDVQVNTQLYTALMNNAQELRVAQAGMSGTARLVDPAGVGALPVQPRPLTVMSVAAGLGLVLALGSVLIARMLRPTVRTADELEQHTGLQTLVSIPESAHQQQLMRPRRLWHAPAQPRLLALRAPYEPAVESLRGLRNSVALRERSEVREHGGGLSVLITAATEQAGKSFVAGNLALLMAATRRRVLLVGLDLRAPRLHTYFAVDRNRIGLVDLLAEQATLDEAIVRDALPQLDLLLPGRTGTNSGELLMHPRFASLMQELAQAYDFVIIDSAPVLPVGDTLAIGRLADITYLVVRSEENSAREVRDAVRRLQSAGVGVDGLVLNGVKRGRLANVPYRGYFMHEVA